MNLRASSVMAWKLHRSVIAACLVYFREIDPTAFWEFCNTIPLGSRLEAAVMSEIRRNRDSLPARILNWACYFLHCPAVCRSSIVFLQITPQAVCL